MLQVHLVRTSPSIIHHRLRDTPPHRHTANHISMSIRMRYLRVQNGYRHVFFHIVAAAIARCHAFHAAKTPVARTMLIVCPMMPIRLMRVMMPFTLFRTIFTMPFSFFPALFPSRSSIEAPEGSGKERNRVIAPESRILFRFVNLSIMPPVPSSSAVHEGETHSKKGMSWPRACW